MFQFMQESTTFTICRRNNHVCTENHYINRRIAFHNRTDCTDGRRDSEQEKHIRNRNNRSCIHFEHHLYVVIEFLGGYA